MRVLVSIVLLACTALSSAQTPADASTPAPSQKPEFAVGKVIPKVVTKADQAQSYTLYLPKNYDPERRWPVVFIFDPRADCSRPMKFAVVIADEFGYIMACSNNSQNGPAAAQDEAARAMMADVNERFLVDPTRIYTGGFSGGARVASAVGQMCRGCITGTFLSGAGFSDPKGPATADEAPFDVFITVGNDDPNFRELTALARKLDSLHIAYKMAEFTGGHEWPPAKKWHEAFAWFETRAKAKAKAAATPPQPASAAPAQ